MEHRDSVGNHGVIGPGGVQWMTAGRGIIHSEMPKVTDGVLHGFQLWINLPAKDKMTKPRYQDYQVQWLAYCCCVLHVLGVMSVS
jgi:quercetin 2,3-dioxygenase